MIENLIEEFRSTYQDAVTQGDFNNILDQFGRIDIRCALDDGVKEQIYQLIQERQNGHVSYGAVETLILEFLIQQNVTTIQQSISTDNLGIFAQKLPLSMLESVTFEFLNQFKNLYKLIQNKYGNIVDYRELERLAKELQRTMKINSIEMVRYIQPLGDNQQKVKVSDILGLVNDFEKMLNEQNRASVGFQQQKNTNNQVQVKNLSSDEEAKHHNDNNERLQKRELANKIYQNTDLLRQKLTGKKEIQCLNDINKSVQILESFNNALFDEIEKIHKRNEELSIEKELSSGQLQQFQLEITSKDQQIQQLLEDNDYFQAQMNTLQDQCDSLRGQCEICNEQLKSVTLIETELKQQQIDNKHQLQLIQKQKIEIERLTQNNHSLMKIITELENKANENVEVENTVQKIQQPFIQQDNDTIQELQQLTQDLQEQLIAIQKEKEGLEVQIIDLKREIAHYKKLYENTNTENQYLRNRIKKNNETKDVKPIEFEKSNIKSNNYLVENFINFLNNQQNRQQHQIKCIQLQELDNKPYFINAATKIQIYWRRHRVSIVKQGQSVKHQYFEEKNINPAAAQDNMRQKMPPYTFKSGAIYEGEWKNSQRDGFGIQNWPDGARYEGQWVENMACGHGKFFHADGDVFEGEWRDDKANGYGVYKHSNGAMYEGEWKDDLQHGKGTETWQDKSKYSGHYVNGLKQGKGRYDWADGSYYEGEWHENKINGTGTYKWADGRGYTGQWLDNNMNGKGVYEWKDGRKYDGEYLNDKKHGFGIYYWADGIIYEGGWKNGKQHGEGKYYLNDGTIKIGISEDGKIIRWLEDQ